jgi:hypothetical protein
VPDEIIEKGKRRYQAKISGNFVDSDRIRVEIEKAGYRIVDADGIYAIFKNFDQ